MNLTASQLAIREQNRTRNCSDAARRMFAKNHRALSEMLIRAREIHPAKYRGYTVEQLEQHVAEAAEKAGSFLTEA